MSDAIAVTGRPPADARRLAVEITTDLAALPGHPLLFRGIDLGPALEQVLFTTLRAPDAVPASRRSRVPAAARGIAAATEAVRRRSPEEPAEIMVLLLAGVHHRLFEPVAAELRQRRPPIRVQAVTARRAAHDPALESLPTVAGALRVRDALSLARGVIDQRDVMRVIDDRLASEEAALLHASLGATLVRLRIEAARLQAAIARINPRVIATYDEIDAWSRLVAAVAAPRGLVTVDLPHAAAADSEAIRGVGYDLMGVYGPRAARVVVAAGVDPSRVRIVGASAFDPLVLAEAQPVEDPPRVVMAAQYRNRLMTDDIRAGILDAAAAAAAAVGARLQVCPHPVEPSDAWATDASRAARRLKVAIDVAPTGSLHRLLPGASLMVTGWSNSVFESILSGVPALTLHLVSGDPPMPFAVEGIAAEARSSAEAAGLAPKLAWEPGRAAALTAARSALTEHLGPLDGRATDRTTDLLVDALG